jgi:hypothetical protein
LPEAESAKKSIVTSGLLEHDFRARLAISMGPWLTRDGVFRNNLFDFGADRGSIIGGQRRSKLIQLKAQLLPVPMSSVSSFDFFADSRCHSFVLIEELFVQLFPLTQASEVDFYILL